LNYEEDGLHRQSLCIYDSINTEVFTAANNIGDSLNKLKNEKSESNYNLKKDIINGEQCPIKSQLTQNLKTGDRNGKYSS
jgi:hypothetical protein